MAGAMEFDVLDYPKEALRTDYKDFFRIHLAPGTLKAMGLKKGDPCEIKMLGASVGTVIAWEYHKSSKIRDLYIPKHLQTLYGVGRGAKVFLSKIDEQLPSAFDVTLFSVASNQSRFASSAVPEDELKHWAWILEDNLKRAENLAPSMLIEGVEAKSQHRSFRIIQINGSSTISPHRFQQSCKVEVLSENALNSIDAMDVNNRDLSIPTDGVGGLEAQLKELNSEILSFGNIESRLPMRSSLPKWINGIILHGLPGVGKTFLLKRIAEAGWHKVFDLGAELSKYSKTSGNALVAMENMFEEAKKCQPSIILLDDLEILATDNETHSSAQYGAFINVLRQKIECLGSFRTLVVATARSLVDISLKLRSVHGLSLEIEIPVPNLKSRASILKMLSDIPTDATNILLETIASRTHGFVGADLAMLLQIATREARNRTDTTGNVRNQILSIGMIEEQDFDSALRKVRPTAIREVFVEIQQTTWDDIGGQQEVKEILRQALIWPTKYIDIFQARGIIPRKGLLLYGPPGCSKTMTARAAATESGFNFVAVKGAELLNMYVGESERKIREIFSKARAASPSILFFDEIDAIGTSRNDGQHSSLNIVTTLLNELDGIVGLTGVFVLAATNRPDLIDSALTRAGRLDEMLYIGPPDMHARRHILNKQLQKMEVQEDMDLEVLAQETDGFSGAEIIKICNDAQLAPIGIFEMECAEGPQQVPGVGRKHFDNVLRRVHKAITPEMLQVYQNFRLKHASQHLGKQNWSEI